MRYRCVKNCQWHDSYWRKDRIYTVSPGMVVTKVDREVLQRYFEAIPEPVTRVEPLPKPEGEGGDDGDDDGDGVVDQAKELAADDLIELVDDRSLPVLIERGITDRAMFSAQIQADSALIKDVPYLTPNAIGKIKVRLGLA